MKRFVQGSALALASMAAVAGTALGASTVVVAPTDTQGWTTADTRTGGSVTFVAEADAPGDGSLQLTTDSTNEAKAQYMHLSDLQLDAVNELAYSYKQVAGPSHAAPSFQLAVDLNGAETGGFTTFVYEPYQNGGVTPGVWETKDVDQGQFWSTRSFGSNIQAGAGGTYFYTLGQINGWYPDAVLLGYGVNVGTYNPGYTVLADGVTVNGTTYDFEVTAPDTTAPAMPTLVSPANNATVTTSNFTFDWNDVADESGVTYTWQASYDPAFGSVLAQHAGLTASEVYSPGTPDGAYYWRVMAIDTVGNESDWSAVWKVTVDTTPEEPVLVGPPTTKDACKNGGWMTFNNPSFKNQGQCVSYVASNNHTGNKPH